MRKLIAAPLVLSVLFASILLLDKIVTGDSLGPTATVVLAVLAGIAVLSLISLRPHRERTQRLIGNIWLTAMASLVTYVVSDLVTGYFLIQPLSPPQIPDPVLHHRMEPHTFSRFHAVDYDYLQRVNNLGLRGRDLEPAKRQGTYRILMLGDSFTMGFGVEDDETFSALLERALRNRRSIFQGKTVEVVNAGVGSYAPVLSFLQLTKYLGRLEPDLVVLNFDMSDVTQETAYRSAGVYGRNGEIIGVSGVKPTPLASRVRSWINRHLYLTRLVLRFIDGATGAVGPPTIENTVTVLNPIVLLHTLTEDQVDRTREWENIFDSIRRIRDYCRNRRIRFLLTLYPWGHQVNNREWVPGRNSMVASGAVVSDRSALTLHRYAAENDIELLDVFPAFRAYAGPELLYYKHDAHWTPRGHKLMAEQLEQYLINPASRQPVGRSEPRSAGSVPRSISRTTSLYRLEAATDRPR
jgi:GDSL-like Lipase/Acylhydrolase family